MNNRRKRNEKVFLQRDWWIMVRLLIMRRQRFHSGKSGVLLFSKQPTAISKPAR